MPVSWTASRRRSPCCEGARVTRTLTPPLGVNFTPFPSRLTRTCRVRRSSAIAYKDSNLGLYEDKVAELEADLGEGGVRIGPIHELEAGEALAQGLVEGQGHRERLRGVDELALARVALQERRSFLAARLRLAARARGPPASAWMQALCPAICAVRNSAI